MTGPRSTTNRMFGYSLEMTDQVELISFQNFAELNNSFQNFEPLLFVGDPLSKDYRGETGGLFKCRFCYIEIMFTCMNELFLVDFH